MSGCDFEKKSFSVAMGKATAYCRRCETAIYGGVYKYNCDNLCRACFNVCMPKRKNRIRDFFTSKDRLWNFNYPHLGKTYEIRSKGQFDKLCKEKNLTWRDASLNYKDAYNQKNELDKPTPREDIKKILMETVKDKGLYEALKFKDARRRARRR